MKISQRFDDFTQSIICHNLSELVPELCILLWSIQNKRTEQSKEKKFKKLKTRNTSKAWITEKNWNFFIRSGLQWFGEKYHLGKQKIMEVKDDEDKLKKRRVQNLIWIFSQKAYFSDLTKEKDFFPVR